jgi:hypothetical protein
MDIENQSILQAKSENKTILPTLSNGDTVKTIISQSRYLLYKSRGKWTVNQEERAKLLFELYPDIKTAHAYPSNYAVFTIQIMIKNVAEISALVSKSRESRFKNFNVVLNSITVNYQSNTKLFS